MLDVRRGQTNQLPTYRARAAVNLTPIEEMWLFVLAIGVDDATKYFMAGSSGAN